MATSAAQARKAAIAKRKSRRKDPVARHIDDSADWTKLQDKDPKLRYVLAYDGDSDSGTEYYKDIGYKEVNASKDGVRFGAGRVSRDNGDRLVMRGHVLMAIAKDEYKDIVQYGENGNTGQDRADEIDEKILVKGGVDRLRGEIGSMSGGHMDVKVAED
jgi:hypothetical protein